MPEVEIKEVGIECLDEIRPLWERLNHHHAAVSEHFSEYFQRFSFDQRKAGLETKAQHGIFRLFIARSNGQLAGQCIISLGPDLIGEIDSLFVAEEFRNKKIGDSLMRAALDWFDKNGATSKSIVVIHGNESAHSFYARYGFLPRSTRLTQI